MLSFTGNIPEFGARPYVLVRRVGNYAEAIDEKGRPIVKDTDHAFVIQEAVNYVAEEYCGVVELYGQFDVWAPIVVPVSNYRHITLRGSSSSISGLQATNTVIYSYVDKDFTIKPDVTDMTIGVNGIMSIENLTVRLRGWDASGIFTRNTGVVKNVHVEYEWSYRVTGARKTVGLVVCNANTYIVSNVSVAHFHAGIVIPGSEHGLIMCVTIVGNSRYSEFGILMPHYHPDWWYSKGYTCLNPTIGARHHVFVDIHFFGDLTETDTPASGTAFLISGSLIMFPKNEGNVKNFILTDGFPNVVIKPYITGRVTNWQYCTTGCGPTSSDGEGNLVLGDVARTITKYLEFTVSSDGTSTVYKLGTHNLRIRKPQIAYIHTIPLSDDAKIPHVAYLQDDDGDGIYESIYVKFASPPPQGTNNIKFAVLIETVLPF